MTYRNADTSMWKDDWFLDLEPLEKLLFIYFFTNENTTLTGLYKISLKVVQFETCLPMEFITTTLDKFSKANKVHYENGVIWVVNLRKYNESRSPKVAARIAWELKQIPDCNLKIQYQYSIDTRSTLTLTLTNHNNNNPSEQPENPVIPAIDGFFGEACTYYQNNISMLTPALSDLIKGWCDDYPHGWAIDAMKEAVNNNVRKPVYIGTILKNWKKDGRNGSKPDKQFDPAAHASEVYGEFK